MSDNLSNPDRSAQHQEGGIGKRVHDLNHQESEIESGSITNLEADRHRMKDLSGFLVQLDEYQPVIPESLVSYYLGQSGVISPDSNVLKLLSMATEKLVCDIIADSSSVFQQHQQQENYLDVHYTSSSTPGSGASKGTGTGIATGSGLGGNSNSNVVGGNNITNLGGGGEGDEKKKGSVINRMKRASDTLTMQNLRFGLHENNINK